MRHSEAALALIRNTNSSRPLWLARWNSRWQCFHFVGGHREFTESFRDCLVREVQDELALREPVDFRIECPAMARLEFCTISSRFRDRARYTTEVFHTRLSEQSIPGVNSQPGNRWLTDREIQSGTTEDGLSVGTNMQRVCDSVAERF